MNVQYRLKPLPTSRNGLYLHLVSNLKWHNSQVSCLRTRNHVSMQCLCTKPRVPLQWQGLSRSSPNSWTDRLDDWQIRQLGEERPTSLKLWRSIDEGCVKITKLAICCLIKTKNKVITTVDQKKWKYLKKSKIKVKPTKLSKLSAGKRGWLIRVCFSFAFDWLREWREFSRLFTGRSEAKAMQSRITFDTKLKIARTVV